MELFEIGEDFKVKLNKPWILTIPQFKRLVHRDRGSIGDNDGRKKYRTIRELTFIFHLVDPRSPLENELDDAFRREKALQYAELTEKDLDEAIMEAQYEYEYLLSVCSPSLELLRSAKESVKTLVNHFRTIDFSKQDKVGRLVYSPMEHVKNIQGLAALHKSLQQFEDIVLQELRAEKKIRGKAVLSDKEKKTESKKWLEGNFNPHAQALPVDHPDYDHSGDALQLIEKQANAFTNLAGIVAGIEQQELDEQSTHWDDDEYGPEEEDD